MPRFRSGDRRRKPPKPHGVTRPEQKAALVTALRREGTHDLTVQEVLDCGQIPDVVTIWDAYKVIREYARDHPDRIRKDLTPTGTILVVCLYPTSRAQRRWRA